MKLFSWVQSKLSGSQSTSKSQSHPCDKNQNVKSGDQKEEFSDWPHGILSIGTLFNKASKNDSKELQDDVQQNCPASHQKNVKDFTPDEVRQLQKELSALISSSSNDDLDCLSSLEAENSTNTDETDQEETEEEQHNTIVPNNKSKDVFLDNNMSNAISKKSLSFLLKKIFVCGGGFGPQPSLRDPILLPPKTRMNKILRALLRKKIYPQSPTMARKKCLSRQVTGLSNFQSSNNFGDETDDEELFYLEGTDKSKWVKTDTEYIVLEI